MMSLLFFLRKMKKHSWSVIDQVGSLDHTVPNLHFCPKNQLWFPEKIVDFFGWKTRENVVVLGFLAVDNFNSREKLGWKTRENVGVFFVKIFGQKFDFSNSVRSM